MLFRSPAGARTPALPKGERAVPLWPEGRSVPLFDRAALSEGQVIKGPALIEERETTLVLPPGWTGVVDAIGCITARRNP